MRNAFFVQNSINSIQNSTLYLNLFFFAHRFLAEKSSRFSFSARDNTNTIVASGEPIAEAQSAITSYAQKQKTFEPTIKKIQKQTCFSNCVQKKRKTHENHQKVMK